MAKVKTIRYIGEQDVYNMEVESHHNFSVNGGLIIHNCRYALMSRPRPAPEPQQELSGVYALGELRMMGYSDAQIRRLRDKVKIIGTGGGKHAVKKR